MDDKTRLAEDRTVLAVERTYAAWARTGMTAVAVAIGLRVTFDGSEPPWLPKVVSTVFVAAALYVFYAAWKQVVNGGSRLSGHAIETSPSSRYAISSIGFATGALIAGGFLWVY